MTVKINDELANRLRAHLQKKELNRPAGRAIEEMIDGYLECYPFNASSDVCVHADDCMHRKSVWRWEEDQK